MGKKKRAAGPTFLKVRVVELLNVSGGVKFCQAPRSRRPPRKLAGTRIVNSPLAREPPPDKSLRPTMTRRMSAAVKKPESA